MTTNLPLGHLKISQGDIGELFSFVESCIDRGEKKYCIPLNVTKYVLSKQDEKLKKVILRADVTIADGVPIYWFSRRLGYRRVFRITGIEFAERIVRASKSKNWRIFFLGATSENLKKAVDNLNRRFDSPNIIGSRDGYFQNGDVQKVIDHISSMSPDILFLGLGMPQKEYFIHDHFDKINAAFWLPVGGAFDVWSEAKKRSPFMIQKVGLEWFLRSFYDKQKGKNILRYGFFFLKDFLFYHE